MNVLRRIGSMFVAPPDAGRVPVPATAEWCPPRAGGWADEEPARRAEARDPGCVAVISRTADALPTGASVALALAAERRCSHALVCVWAGAAPAPAGIAAPPHRGAARLARSLAARELPGRATGRLVVARLPADDAAAEDVARSLLAGGSEVPVVLALGAARGPRLEALLGEQPIVLVAVRPGADDAVTRLALTGLGGASACPVPTGAARTLAAAGVALSPALRRRVAEVVP